MIPSFAAFKWGLSYTTFVCNIPKHQTMFAELVFQVGRYGKYCWHPKDMAILRWKTLTSLHHLALNPNHSHQVVPLQARIPVQHTGMKNNYVTIRIHQKPPNILHYHVVKLSSRIPRTQTKHLIQTCISQIIFYWNYGLPHTSATSFRTLLLHLRILLPSDVLDMCHVGDARNTTPKSPFVGDLLGIFLLGYFGHIISNPLETT